MTALAAALVLLPKATPAAAAPEWLSMWQPRLSTAERCRTEVGATSPVDACSGCRAGRGCPADTWPETAAQLLVGAGQNFNAVNSKPWLTRRGRLHQLVRDGQADLAGHAAWQLYEMLTDSRPELADALAALTVELGLALHPQLALVHARAAEAQGDRNAALRHLQGALDVRDGSTHPAWRALIAAQDALRARLVAAARTPASPPPQRSGHTASRARPDRLRFQIRPRPAGDAWAPVDAAPADAAPDARPLTTPR